jgi:hypothetical protein
MKPYNSKPNASVRPHSDSRQCSSLSPEFRGASLCGALLSLIFFFAPRPAAAQAYNRLISLPNVVLFSNMNAQGVASGVTPGVGTLFTLRQQPFGYQYEISEITTYHYNGGAGAVPGVIRLWTASRQLLFAGNARGVPGQDGPNETWIVNINPPVKVAAGASLIVDDSSPQTWAHDPGSAGCLPFSPGFQCGMGAIYGSAVASQQVSPLPAPTPAPAPAPQAGYFPARCVSNTYAFTKIDDPCYGGAGYVMGLLVERNLPFSLAAVRFNLLPPGTNSVNAVTPPPNSPSVIVQLPAGGPTATGSTYRFPLPATAMCVLGGSGSTWQVTPFYVTGSAIGIPSGLFKLAC